MRSSVRSRLAPPYFQSLTGTAKPNPVTLCHTNSASGVRPTLRTQQEKRKFAALSVTPRDSRKTAWFARGEYSCDSMSAPTPISGPASQLLELVRKSEVLRSLVDEHADFRELLIQAADAAAKSSDLEQRLFEAVALSTCTTDRTFEARWSGGGSKDADVRKLDVPDLVADQKQETVLPGVRPAANSIS